MPNNRRYWQNNGDDNPKDMGHGDSPSARRTWKIRRRLMGKKHRQKEKRETEKAVERYYD